MEGGDPEVIVVDEMETEDELSECETKLDSLIVPLIGQDGIVKKRSASAGGNKAAFGNITDLEQERQAIAAERHQLEKSKMELKRKRKEFEAMKKAAKRGSTSDQQRALLTSMEKANLALENANQKLMATENLETEASQRLQELWGKHKEIRNKLHAKKAEANIVNMRADSAVQQMKDAEEKVEKLKRSRTLAEGRLITLERQKEKQRRTQQPQPQE